VGLHAVWRRCACGCGCSHTCSNLYGPYFIVSTEATSKYLGKFEAAVEYLVEEHGLSAGAAKELLLESAVFSAKGMKRRGFSIAPPGERTRHLAEVHGTSPPRARRVELSELEREFWERVEKI